MSSPIYCSHRFPDCSTPGKMKKEMDASSDSFDKVVDGERSHGASTDGDEGNEKDGKERMKHSAPLYKLFSFADSTDMILMGVGTAGALGAGAIMPLITVIVGRVINAFGENQDLSEVVHKVSKVCIQYLYMAIGAFIVSFFNEACWMITGERQATRIRKMYLNALLNQDIAFFDSEINTGEVVGNLTGDTILIQDAMGEKVGKFIQLISTVCVGYTVAFVRGWLLTLVMMSMIPPIVICGWLISKITGKVASRQHRANAEASAIVQQTVSSIRTVASFTGEKLSVKMFEKVLRDAYKSSIHGGFYTGLGNAVTMLIANGVLSIGFWYGGKLVLDKNYSGGDIINILFAVVIASRSFTEVSPCMTTFIAAQHAAYKIFQTINRKPKIYSSKITGERLDVIHGDIEFKDVYFSYPSRPKEKIFTGLRIFIKGGTSVALVGGSGSGKSTVISLIERFYDPQDGEVLIDGINIKKFNLRWLRKKIGLVSQEPVLFASTIRENISYGKNDATIDEIKTATQLANASKFIEMLPQGLETMVGEHGTQLSGGQKQRIAIARAILKDPRILLLDEATSALDVESEQIVQEAIDKVMMNRTTVIVAHRLTTVRNAQCIVVMQKGSILEKGTHSELLKDQNGAYNQLIQLQQLKRNLEQSSEIDQDASNHQAMEEENITRHNSLRRDLIIGSPRRGSKYFSPRHTFSIELDSEENASKQQIKKSKEVPLSRLASLNKPEIPILLIGSVATVFDGLKSPITALVISTYIGIFYSPPDKLKKDSIICSAAFFAFSVVYLVTSPTGSYLFAVAGAKLIRRIRLMVFHKVVNMEIAWFDDPKNSSGAIGAKLSTDAVLLRSLVGDSLALLVRNTATLIFGLSLAFVASWQLSLIILALLPLIGLNGWMIMKFKKGYNVDAKMMHEEVGQVANDAVRNIRTVASFSAEKKVMEMYNKRCEAPMHVAIKQGVTSGIILGISFSLLYFVNAIIFYVGAHLVGSGNITFKKVFQAFFVIIMTIREISMSRSDHPDSNIAKSIAGSIFTILDRNSKIDPCNDSGLTLEVIQGNIEFHHVSFTYPTRPDVKIFKDICLSIQSGKIIAFVGESGSGKSTAISLLQRFYDPDSGHILLDGIEIQKFQLRWFRQQMGLVSQEPILFNDTIHANIAYGKEENADEAEIIAAAELANAHMFISSLNQGYQTLVGERGVQLSGGQKQRVAIARAMIKQPKILLLDEATSALDTESERIVQDALNHVMVNRTTIIVAHRLATIKNADLIAIIKDGVIVEQGNHDTLLNIKNGVYASLVAHN